MRVLIVSDVHANLVALEAVLRAVERDGPIDAVWSLGDCVGYGPQPSDVIARLKGFEAVMVAGNHERAATGAIGTGEFNASAAAAARWTKERLTPGERSFLDALPEVIEGAGLAAPDGFTLVHGTLRWPIWEYMVSAEEVLGHLALQQTPFGLVGHTHVPMVAGPDEKASEGCHIYRLEDGDVVTLDPQRRIVVNPGSVGQPRDGDPRASYAVYDTGSSTITLHRVDYDIAATQKLMAEAQLPRWLIERLSAGR